MNPGDQEPSGTFKRVNYFHGQLLSAQDLEDEQRYHRAKRRLHNRLLHGWGVVCGLQVSLENGEVRVEPGFALDCQGNEIVVRSRATARPPEATRDHYIVVQYAEQPSDYLPAPGAPEPQPSRVTETYEIRFQEPDPCDHSPATCLERLCSTAHPVPLAKLEWRRERWSVRPHTCVHRSWWSRILAFLLGRFGRPELAP